MGRSAIDDRRKRTSSLGSRGAGSVSSSTSWDATQTASPTFSVQKLAQFLSQTTTIPAPTDTGYSTNTTASLIQDFPYPAGYKSSSPPGSPESFQHSASSLSTTNSPVSAQTPPSSTFSSPNSSPSSFLGKQSSAFSSFMRLKSHPSREFRSPSTSSRTDFNPPLASSTSSSHAPHPYQFMSSSVVASNEEEEITCPVCLEPLSFRLVGEKPHIVPICGHKLHEACFEAVYGGVARARMRGGSLGLCGVCRGDMKLGDEGDGPIRKNNKSPQFAALSGIPQPSSGDSHKMRSISHRTLDLNETQGSLHDPTEDDDLVRLPTATLSSSRSTDRIRGSTSTNSTGSTVTGVSRRGSADTMKGPGSSAGGSSYGSGSQGGGAPAAGWEIVKPIVTVRAEHGSIARTVDREKKQQITCMVSIEMPSRWHPVPPPMAALATTNELPELEREDSFSTLRNNRGGSAPPSTRSGDTYSAHHVNRPSSPTPSSVYSAYAYGSTAAASPEVQTSPGPFASVVADLQSRMADWKGHSPTEFGALKLYDYIHVRKERNVREFLVYLFEEAILCVTDDKRKGLAGKIVDGISGGNDKLRLKGRVYIRHIRSVFESSKDGELSLTIVMSDDNLDEFIMTFKDRSNLDVWKAQIDSLVHIHNSPTLPLPPPPAPSAGMSRNGRGIVNSSSGESFNGSDYSSDGSSRQTHSSTFSGYTRTTSSSTAPLSSSIIHEEDSKDLNHFDHHPSGSYAASSSSASIYPQMPSPNANVLRDFTPLDLMLILSVPASGPTSLKVGIIKNALDFIVQSVGPRTRLSVVTFSAGDGLRGVLRKTPFIAVGKADGRRRLEAVIEELGSDSIEGIGMIEHKEERVNVVTAVNLALDIVLQRKVKSALTGMVLMNDGKDGAQKQQMDLVMARAEAANVPIHAIGWGRAHDPSSLWLLSNHTSGTYTFCREFYDLRDTMAGCIGGILSIAATNVKLHISVPERRWFRIRKVSGTQAAIVSSEGKDVDIEIGELRFGERKDLLVEVEMSLAGYGDPFNLPESRPEAPAFSTATDAFFLSKVGLNPSALDEFQPSNFFEDEYDGMPDEVPLFEVNAAFRDPAAGKTISRLNNSPCLLTITVTPPTPPGSRAPNVASAPEIVRRRMELLSSDMCGKFLLLKGRRNDAQAKRLLEETKRIIQTIMGSLAPAAAPPSRSGRRSSQLSAQAVAHSTLLACYDDVSTILEGSSENDQFESTFRNFAAQQAVVLREQKSWTPRSPIERLFFQTDNSLYLYQRSQNWVSTRTTE